MQEPELRPDYKEQQKFFKDQRSAERLMAHYVLEKRLANKLRNASAVGRSGTYCDVYTEVFRTLPDHPQKTVQKESRARRVNKLLRNFIPYFSKDNIFLEIGCGDAALCTVSASHVKRVYALDVTDALIDYSKLPNNLNVLITNGTKIPLPENSVDFVFSDQLMEHLHPDDACDQLAEIFRVLKTDAIYYCITPNRITGPHDISALFDYESTGFHLKEYDSKMISTLFKKVGFRSVEFFVPVGGVKVPVPRLVLRALESALWCMPHPLRARAARSRVVGALAGLYVIGTK